MKRLSVTLGGQSVSLRAQVGTVGKKNEILDLTKLVTANKVDIDCLDKIIG